MKITQNNTKELMATLTIDVEFNDYNEKTEKVLNDYRRTAVIPGFRKGKTPMSIINKKYRISVVVDEVNKLIQDELYKYIKDAKFKILGSPMPIQGEEIDWNTQKDFKFIYEIGLAPEFELKITKKDKLNYHKIKVDDKLIMSYCKDITKRHGKMTNPDISEDGDSIFCAIIQLDVDGKIKKDGISNEATVSMEFISNKKIKQQFIGLKKNDIININVMKAFTNHSDLSGLLNISHEKIHDLESQEFQFTVKNVNRLEPAELNTQLFDKIYGKGNVKNEKEFKLKVKEEAESHFIVESDRLLKHQVVTYLIEKLKLKIPDEFLKRWLVKKSENPITIQQVESEYDLYVKSLQWQLIENKILEEYQIKVTQEEVLYHTKNLIKMQMKQYNQLGSDEKNLTDIANNILKNEDERKKIYDQIYDQRTLIVYKEKFKLIDKSISYDDFIKLASKK